MANIFRNPCDAASIQSGSAAAPCSREAQPWVLAATILGSSLAFIDGTVVNVALPALQSQMNATIMDVQWVVEAYALFLAALLLTGGALGERFGARHSTTHRRPVRAGHRCRAARARQPCHHQRLVPGGRTGEGNRHLVGFYCYHLGVRAGSRRI